MRNSILLQDDCSTGSCLQLDKAKIVSAVDFDEAHSFMIGFGVNSSPCEEWLLDTILTFLRSEDSPVVLIEDFIASPGDPVLSRETTAPMWFYGNRVLWPIQKDMANVESCNNALAWAAGGPRMIFFCSPVDLSDLTIISDKFTVPENCLVQIKNHNKFVIIDAFDSEGYVMVPIK